jgi:phosphoglycolate phosphatase-like HAD superfamily hydrolase
MVNDICIENAVSNGFMVGDCDDDIKAGKFSNLKTIAVNYGYQSLEQLKRANPTFTISNINELIKIINDN